jgi:hypothetical protein
MTNTPNSRRLYDKTDGTQKKCGFSPTEAITAADLIPEPTCNLLPAIPNNLTNAKHLSISNNIQILLGFWV